MVVMLQTTVLMHSCCVPLPAGSLVHLPHYHLESCQTHRLRPWLQLIWTSALLQLCSGS